MALLKIIDRLAIIPHISGIQITQYPHSPFAMCNQRTVGLELQIFSARTRNIGVKIDAVCYLGHERFDETHRDAATVS